MFLQYGAGNVVLTEVHGYVSVRWYAGRWSVRGCVPTLEHGNQITLEPFLLPLLPFGLRRFGSRLFQGIVKLFDTWF